MCILIYCYEMKRNSIDFFIKSVFIVKINEETYFDNPI